MDRDEEKDLFIKAKLKDGYIPEKIDNLFNNSAQIFENERGMNMEENSHKPKKNQIILKRIVGIAACAVIALGGGQIYASTQGYDNIFFMIKELIVPSQEVQGKEEILSDRDITISYQPIQITENISIVISKMQIKDNEAKIILSVKRNNIDENDGLPLSYKINNSEKKLLCEQIGNEGNDSTISMYQEELILEKYSKEDKVLNLEIYKSNSELISTISIDLENKEINVLGQEEHIEKLSEIELKEFLGSISKLHPTDSATGTCIDITNISYSGGYYTVTYTYCYLGENSLFDIDINNIEIYQNTVGLKLNEDGMFKVISMQEPIIIQKNKAEMDNSTTDTDSTLWQDFSGTYALKTAHNQGNEINPKEWSSWSNNNWVVFYDNGIFKDTLFSKIFTNKLTVGGKYRFQDNSVVLTYDNGEIITLEGDIENCTLTGNIDEYEVTIVGYSHSDLSKYDSKFLGTWNLQYGMDWTTFEGKEIRCSELYDENVYGEILGIYLTIEQNGNMEYLISGSKKSDRYQATWESVTISENKIKVTLDKNTIIYMDYYASERDGKECISFQSINNNMHHEYYYKTELNNNENGDNKNKIVEDERFVGTWNFEYAFDWSTGVKRKLQYNDLYNKEIYGEILSVNLTIEDNGNYEYSIGGSKKVDRYTGTWERDENSNNTLKIILDEHTIIFVNYHETDDNGVECLSFQSKQNEFAREYYYK